MTRKLCEYKHPNWNEIVIKNESAEPKATIIFSAEKLRRILESFPRGDDAVTMEIRGSIDGVVMRGIHTYAILLPKRSNEKLKRAQFIYPEIETAEGGGEKMSMNRTFARYIQRERIKKSAKLFKNCPVCGCSMKYAWYSRKTRKCPFCKTVIRVPWVAKT